MRWVRSPALSQAKKVDDFTGPRRRPGDPGPTDVHMEITEIHGGVCSLLYHLTVCTVDILIYIYMTTICVYLYVYKYMYTSAGVISKLC